MLTELTILLSAIEIKPFTLENGITLAVIIVLLSISAFVSGSEISFFSLTPQQRNDMHEADTEADRNVFALLERPDYLLATILTLNNFVNVAIVMLTALFIDRLFIFEPWLEFLVQTIIITFLLLLFGEIMPKIAAQQNPVRMSRRAAKPFLTLVKLCKPIAFILVKSTKSVHRFTPERHDNLSLEEMEEAIDLTSGTDVEDKNILHGIVNFGTTTVDAVMTSRLDMVTVDLKMPYLEVLQIVERNGYSRIPVVQSSNDDIRGVLYIKDLLPHLAKGNSFRWQSLIRPAYFVPDTKKLDDLLREFQKNKIHVAIVVDEFGGTLGMVTMEDILEEVVGDISDEHDDEEKLYRRLNGNTYMFEAKIPLVDFFKATNVEENEFEHYTDEVDTLAGLLLELKGDMPVRGEKIEFAHYSFEVMEADNRRIRKIKFHVGKQPKQKNEK